MTPAKKQKGPPPGVGKQVMWKRLQSYKRRNATLPKKMNAASFGERLKLLGVAAAGGAAFAKFPKLSNIGGRLDAQLVLGVAGAGYDWYSSRGNGKGMPFAGIAGLIGWGMLVPWAWNFGAGIATQGLQPSVSRMVIAEAA